MDAVTGNLEVFLEGLRTTAILTVVSFAAALTLGTLVAAARVSPVAPLRLAGTVYVELVRNTPLVVLMFLLYFGLPKIDIRFEPIPTAILALSLYTAAFVAEVVRAGINTVSRGQAEAARALGLTFSQTLASVVLPLAMRTVVPPLGSLFIALIRNTAVAYTISVAELTARADRLGNDTAESVAALLAAGVVYMALTIPSGVVVGVLERRLAVKR
ncbi:MAG: amino acid ABC transporter permease [Acidimicrobiia bacterium]